MERAQLATETIAYMPSQLTQTSAHSALGTLDQFNLVAIRVSHKGNHRAAALDRAGFARDVAASRFDLFASRINVRHAQRDMTVGGAHLVVIGAVVPGQFDFGMLGVVAIADKSQAVFVLRVFRPA